MSSSTKEKMRKAGMNPDQPSGGPGGGNASGGPGGAAPGGSKQSVASSRDDIEELKSQNEKIIELLKRLNQKM